MKKTITTRDQVLVNGVVKERTATHIVTGAHGWETLCTRGFSSSHDEHGNLIQDATEIARDKLPITCQTCLVIWHDVHGFQSTDFCAPEKTAKYLDTLQTCVDLECDNDFV